MTTYSSEDSKGNMMGDDSPVPYQVLKQANQGKKRKDKPLSNFRLDIFGAEGPPPLYVALSQNDYHSDVTRGVGIAKRRCRYSKSDRAQDGCTVLCRAPQCFQIGIHRCARCLTESYCSEFCRLADRERHAYECQLNQKISQLPYMKNFQGQRQDEDPCCGWPGCSNPISSFCQHCKAPVCDAWNCSKWHLDHCHAYADEVELAQGWVWVDYDEDWVKIDRVASLKR